MTVYEVMTKRIVEMLESGTAPWRKPWVAGGPRNLVSGKAYRGLNVFLLTAAGARYSSAYWLTFKQALDKGGNVRKGESGLPVVFWRFPEPGTQNDDQAAEESSSSRRGPLLRYATVFNVEQCDGVEAPKQEVRTFSPIDEAERILSEMPNCPPIRHGGSQAFYVPSLDYVQLPSREAFLSPEHYYSTAAHELGHATGHSSRLDRPGITDGAMAFGSHSYSKEELVAEMTAAFVCGAAGLDNSSVLDNSAAYLASWIKVLKGDSRLVVSAASAAQKAADYILGNAAATAAEEPSAVAA